MSRSLKILKNSFRNLLTLKRKTLVTSAAVFCLFFHQFANSNEHDPLIETENPLILGVLPYTLPGPLLKRFSNFRNYLKEQLGQEILISTTANYKKFIKNTASRQYDIVWTAPHFVLLALDSGHYEISSTWKRPLETVLVTNKMSPILSLKQLARQTISTPPASAIVTLYAKHHLQNLQIDSPEFKEYKGHDASYMATITGSAAAAVTEYSVYEQAIKKGVPLRIIKRLPSIPGIGILLAKDLPQETRQRIKKALHNLNKNIKGQQVIDTHGFPDYRAANADEFKILRPFLDFYSKPAPPAQKETP